MLTLIKAAGSGARHLTGAELRSIRDQVSRAGFDPTATDEADRRVSGLPWSGGPSVAPGDQIPVAELHYLRHVIARQEWPTGTLQAWYEWSIRELALDPRSGVLVSQYRPFGWHVAIVGRSGRWRGPQGFEWMMVEYRVGSGHWMTAFQLEDGFELFKARRRTDKVWLRLPT